MRGQHGGTSAQIVVDKSTSFGKEWVLVDQNGNQPLAKRHQELTESNGRHDSGTDHACFRALIENSWDIITVVDAQGIVRYQSPSIERVLGYHPEDLVGKPLFEHLHPQDLPQVAAAFNKLLAMPGARARVNARIRHCNGNWRFLEAIETNLLHDPAVRGIIANYRDVTNRKLAEDALRRSEERCRSIVETTQEGIWVVDEEGKTTFANPRMAEMLGLTVEDLKTRSIFDFMDEGGSALAAANLKERQGNTEQPDFKFICADGRELWASVSITPLFDADGQYRGSLSSVADITDRKRAEEALMYQVLYDSLTGLPNRALLTDRLQRAITCSRRLSEPAALLLLDLDRFRYVNETFGHECGDALLGQIGPRLRAVLRESDTIARLGGDEFAVVSLRAGQIQEAVAIAEDILHALEAPFTVESYRLEVTASIGIVLHPFHGDDAQTLLRHADAAMYLAKRQRNGYAVYAAEMDRHPAERLALTSELRHGIATEQLELFYQPKVDIQGQHVVGAEALVRWRHPVRGLVQPDLFIPLAEQTGLIRPLSQWVVKEAVRQLRTWQDAGLKMTVAINLTMSDLRDPQLSKHITQLLRDWKVDPSWLKIEITETMIMADPAQTMAVVTRLHDQGLTFCIDDFGTAYSSLAYLRQLPAQEIKIDRSFVMGLLNDEDNATIVRSVIDLAHNLDRTTVAEGVENPQIWDALASLGCDVGQGYYMGKPMPTEQFEHWLTHSPWARPQELPHHEQRTRNARRPGSPLSIKTAAEAEPKAARSLVCG